MKRGLDYEIIVNGIDLSRRTEKMLWGLSLDPIACRYTGKIHIIKEVTLKKAELTLPQIGLIAGTRGMIGAGAGLLLADKLNDDQRRAIGWTLLLIGAISTIPLAIDVLSKRR